MAPPGGQAPPRMFSPPGAATTAPPAMGPGGGAPPPPTTAAAAGGHHPYAPAMMAPPPGGARAGGVHGPTSSPHYAGLAGGAGEPDQPLAEKFCALSLTAPQGHGSAPMQPDPQQMPRPTGDDLAEPFRWELREVADPTAEAASAMHPKFVRMTCGAMPVSTATKNKAGLPIGAIIQPLAQPADQPVPLVNFGQVGVVRCRRCRTYVNAFAKFIDGGRRWRCNVCGLANEVPPEYFCELDGEGNRRDRMERPELHLATVEFVAAAEYMVRPPQPPVYLFLIEASYAAVSSGMLRCVAATLAHTLDRLPGGERTQVALMTFDTTLHFYNLSGSSPQMLVVSEIDEVFLPTPGMDDLLVNLSESRDSVVGLLEKLPAMFASTQATEVALGPALKAAYQLIQHIGGKLAVFSATRPTVGEAKLKARGEGAPAAKAAGGGDGKGGASLLQPESEFYKNLAVDGSKQQVCIDVWSCAGSYTDLASISQLSKHTSGSIYYYPNFSDVTMGERLSRDLQHNLTRQQGWEAVMRVRVSRGLE